MGELGAAQACAQPNAIVEFLGIKKISSVGGRYKSLWFYVCRIDYHQLFPQ